MFVSVLLFLNIGGSEMILIFVVALFLFGGDKLPEIARGLGRGIREFKDASENVKREINNQINNYEERREEAEANSTPVIEAPKELSAAADEHTAWTPVEDAEHDAPNPVIPTNGVPNTMPFVENNGTLADHTPASETEHSDTATENKTEAAKTTHV